MAARREVVSSKEPVILLEVRPASESGDLGPGGPTLEQFSRRAGEVAESVAQIAEEFRSRLQKTLRKPTDSGWHTESIELGFEIAVQAEAGVVIARAVSGATFTAKLTLKAPADKQ
jgi:Trypsin-co-occurring domain 1